MDVIATTSRASEPNLSHAQDEREWVKDLLAPKAAIFWSDLLLSATLGWVASIVACLEKPFDLQQSVSILIAAIAFYRALVFIHELTHMKEKALPGFTWVWNLVVGIPLLLPSFTYTGVHAEHHRLSTYGTDRDPEYLPFAGKKGAIFFFVIHSFLLPGLLALRFLVLSPIGLLFPPFHRLLERHASSLSMNLAYCRKVSALERDRMKRIELLLLAIWTIPLSLIGLGVWPWRIIAIWYAVMALIMLMNSLRTLGAHRYRSNGRPMNLADQLLDSVDTPGSFWTVLWAPVGLRYHALHHYFPSMPYHNLPIARERLIQDLPPDTPYRQTTSPSLGDSLKQLWNDRRDGQPT